MERQNYPSDVSDDEWSFVAPHLTLMTEEAPQREHSLREVFNGLRWIVRTGAQWRMMPHDLPPWAAVYQQTRAAGSMLESLRPSRAICARCCDWLKDATNSHRPPFLTAERCNRVQRVGIEQVTMEPSGAKAAKCIWRLIPWGTCWHCISRLPMSKIVLK